MLNHKPWYSSIWLLSFISLLLVTITAGFLISFHFKMKPEVVTQKVNTITRARMEVLVSKTHDLIDQLNAQVEPDLVSIDPTKAVEEDISLFVEKKGKLVYWSDNKVSYETVKESSEPSKSLIRLPNGWYLCYRVSIDSFDVTSLALVKHAYPYTNDYLSNAFHRHYNLTVVPEILEEPGRFNVTDLKGEFLFSLNFDHEKDKGSSPTIWFILILFLLSLVFLQIWLFYLHQKFNPLPSFPNLPILAFALDMIIVRGLIFYFSFPAALHDFDIFHPQFYASSWINRSLGDLLLNMLFVLTFAYVVAVHWRPTQTNIAAKSKNTFKGALMFLLVPGITLLFARSVRSLIFDSTLTFNLNNLLSVDVYSFIGLIIIVMAAAALLLLLFRSFEIIMRLVPSKKHFLLASIPALVLVLIYFLTYQDAIAGVMVMVLILGSLIRILPVNRKEDFFIYRILLLLIIGAASVTWLINSYDDQKEKELIRLVASNDAQNDDPMAEYLFGKAKEQMFRDTALAEMLFHDSIDEETIITYLLKNYFSGGEQYWARYNFQVTICNEQQNLIIGGQNRVVSCFEFFNGQIKEFGILTMVNGFYLIYDPFGQANYLGMLQFENLGPQDKGTMAVFIEIFPKIVPVEVGYLDLLVDKAIKDEATLYTYAHARYHKGQLVSSYGKYVYSMNQAHYSANDSIPGFFIKGGYTHYYFPTTNNKVLMVSVPEKQWLDKIAPFSLFLLVFILLYTFALLFRNILVKKAPFKTNFKNRLQLTLLFVIVFSFMVIGIASVYYISILNRNKNTDTLKDKARSIRIEVEHKLADKAILNEELKPYIETILLKFNDVFATDINLFDTDGKLLGTSRQRIFNEGLISKRMNTIAYREMVLNQKTLLIHEENIGRLKFLSAYIPFKNNQNRVIAYINLPYFARQSELSNEISSFVMAFINIYLLLIAITIIFAFFLSDRISKPLILIRERMQQVRLGAANEKIAWRGHDEISDLVNEYNRMVDELEKSAELLAKSERETAWREMARQVAHEIKNPLTPMKLNLQHLEQTIYGDADHWREKFSRFAKVMLQQIDSLSTIATAFSDFANMPRGTTSVVSLEEIISKATILFEGYHDVTVITRPDPSARAEIKGDPEQLSRVVINLITNAVQAKIPDRLLTVTVTLKHHQDHWLLTIQDDGKGISGDISSKIFIPNFTTKTSGMGLGLAIAKSIIEGMGGSISFSSEAMKGTTFSVVLPIE